MSVICPACYRSLPSTDGGDAPAFCMYCGRRLAGIDRPTVSAPLGEDLPTQPFTPSIIDSVVGGDDRGCSADHELPPDVPSTVGGYRLLRLIGAGGMGAVYEAEVPDSRHRVAVKLLSARLASSPVQVERFRQEGQLASQLIHPRCVFVLAADTDAGRPYIVMELMPGQTLKDLVDRRGPLPPEEAVGLILDVIDGLREAHRLGMIHRDIKPSNCFLTADGRVKVGDFGLSKSLVSPRDRHLTQSGTFLGTILFASPEQIRGEPLDYGSDIYSVCATLYYLLCGQAPFQSESVTATLAKAISEPAPPLRRQQPHLSRGLEAVVLKGLERNRDRRWQTLDDLRDALVRLLPDRQVPARPRALIGAYVLDRIILAFVIVPIELAHQWATGADEAIEVFELRLVNVSLQVLYFTLGEGLFGTTVGKMAIGLRVSRVGRTGPPGLLRAFVRSAVFVALLSGLFVIPQECIATFGPTTGGVLGGVVFVTSVLALLAQLRRRWGYRGLHDLASGCHVTQLPLPSRRLRLAVKHPTPLETLLPPAAGLLPESVGGFAVRGRVAADPVGSEQVWVGEDRALGRTVLLVLRPAEPGTAPPPEVARPTRLRQLGRGSICWDGTNYRWVAFSAPLGGPLQDAIDPRHPLRWADARLLLEQLTDEFVAAEADGTLPKTLTLGQVWAEQTGRLQFLDCVVCGGPTGAGSPLELLRQVASLTLEGRPRSQPGPVRAPLPSHAVPLMDRLFTPGGYTTLKEFQCDLAETHAHRPEVTPAVRAVQLGLQAAVLVVPLSILFVLTLLLAPLLTYIAAVRAEQAEAALAAVTDPESRDKLAKNPALVKPLQHPRLVGRLHEFRDRKRAEAEWRRSFLFMPQRLFLETLEFQLPYDSERAGGYPEEVTELVRWAGAADGTPRAKQPGPWRSEVWPLLATLLAIPLGIVVLAGVLRGGLSMLLGGIAIVRGDGRPADFRRCALRTLFERGPQFAALLGAAWLQAFAPERAYLAAGLWLLAVALIPISVVIALRFPDRGPHDRLAGTHLVPA